MWDTLPTSALQTSSPALVACGEQAPAPAGWGWSRPEQSSLPPRVWGAGADPLGWRASLQVGGTKVCSFS